MTTISTAYFILMSPLLFAFDHVSLTDCTNVTCGPPPKYHVLSFFVYNRSRTYRAYGYTVLGKRTVITVEEVATGKTVHQRTLNDILVPFAASISPSGQMIAVSVTTSRYKNKIFCWGTTQNKTLQREYAMKHAVLSLAWKSDSVLYAGSAGLYVLNPKSPEKNAALHTKLPGNSYVDKISHSFSNDYFAFVVDNNPSNEKFPAPKMRYSIMVSDGKGVKKMGETNTDVQYFKFTPGKKRLLVVMNSDNAIGINTKGTGKIVLYDMTKENALKIHTIKIDNAWCASFHPDKDIIAVGCLDGMVHVVDMGKLQIIRSFKATKDPLMPIRFVSFGKSSLTAVSEKMRVWETTKWEIIEDSDLLKRAKISD